MWFGVDTQTAALDIQTGLWVCTFGPYVQDRVIQWISLQGPQSSTCNVYIDTVFMDITARGDFNRADYYQGIPLARGRQMFLKWNVGTGTAPVASLGCTDGKAVSALTDTGTIFTAG